MSKEILLTQGKIAIVDDDDYEYLSQFNWYANLYRKTWYAIRCEKRQTIFMHRVIMTAPPGMEVDHRDQNGLNNRKDNLRLATHSQNKDNRPPMRGNRSGFKGVRKRAEGQWEAQIKHHRTRYYLGRFNDPVDAARAYDSKARELHGEFAWLNFPEHNGGNS